jgi:FkbM family methyltransferase
MRVEDIKRTYSHPLNRKRKLLSVLKYFRLGLYLRMNKSKMFVHPYIHNTKLLVGKKSTSAMLQYLNGLNDFEEMALILHFLSGDDIFVDVGANVGVYSILSSGVSGAKSIAIEPSNESAEIFRQNIAINNLESRITLINCVVGNRSGAISFTKGLDAINRVTREDDLKEDTEIIEEDTLDNLLKNDFPSCIKIDVEGFELNVLKGAKNILKRPELKILLIETNGLSSKYQLDEEEIFAIVLDNGFLPYTYSPVKREFSDVDMDSKQENTIFIRDIEYVRSKVKSSNTLNINGLTI